MSDNVCQESLACDLIRIGLVPGDMVYVHSSMKKIGWIQGGPEALVQAFLEVLGPEGTLAVPTHTLSFPGRGAEPFDAMSTPTVLGLFPEIVRRYPGALRSGHASHSSAAIGAKASFLTKGHDPCHALAEQSPLYRLCRNGVKARIFRPAPRMERGNPHCICMHHTDRRGSVRRSAG